MPAANSLQYLYLAYFSKPVGERRLYRLIRQRRITRILEIGVGVATRARRMMSVAQRGHDAADIRYTGIDPFESRPGDAPPGLTLKLAHRLLKPSGAGVQLVPGDPYAALSRAANGLTGVELVVIAADQEGDALSRAWYYLPRTLADDALVFVERLDPVRQDTFFLQAVERDELARLASVHQRRRAA